MDGLSGSLGGRLDLRPESECLDVWRWLLNRRDPLGRVRELFGPASAWLHDLKGANLVLLRELVAQPRPVARLGAYQPRPICELVAPTLVETGTRLTRVPSRLRAPTNESALLVLTTPGRVCEAPACLGRCGGTVLLTGASSRRGTWRTSTSAWSERWRARRPWWWAPLGSGGSTAVGSPGDGQT